jgi:hypothetical protein
MLIPIAVEFGLLYPELRLAIDRICSLIETALPGCPPSKALRREACLVPLARAGHQACAARMPLRNGRDE